MLRMFGLVIMSEKAYVLDQDYRKFLQKELMGESKKIVKTQKRDTQGRFVKN